MGRWTMAGMAWRSLLLGAATVSGLGVCAARLPGGPLRDAVVEAGSVPAALLAQVFYGTGMHWSLGAPSWGLLVQVSSILFYSMLWWVVLSLVGQARPRPASRWGRSSAAGEP